MLEEENDEELREMAKEELNEAKATVEKTENELKILLFPKDPNDSKNVIVEIRPVQGEMMKPHYLHIEIHKFIRNTLISFKWKVELDDVNDNGAQHIVPRGNTAAGNAACCRSAAKRWLRPRPVANAYGLSTGGTAPHTPARPGFGQPERGVHLYRKARGSVFCIRL